MKSVQQSRKVPLWQQGTKNAAAEQLSMKSERNMRLKNVVN
jgi:hypothetical protein